MAHPYKQHTDAERRRAGKLFGHTKSLKTVADIRNPKAPTGGFKNHEAAEVSVSGASHKKRIDRFARGGKVKHSDEKEDKALIRGMVKGTALKRSDGGPANDGDSAKMPYQASSGERESAVANMAKVGAGASATQPTAGDRSALSDMARKASEKKYARGGRLKGKHGGKTNINIVFAKDKSAPDGGMPMPPVGGPPMGAGAPPMMPPPGMGLGGPKPPFKRGGKVSGQRGGADSGVGRLDKVKMQKGR